MLLRGVVVTAMFVVAVALGLHSAADPLLRIFAGFMALVAITLGALMLREASRRG